MSDNSERDSMHDALIIATGGGIFIWYAIYYGFRLLDISLPELSRVVLFLIIWLFIFLFCRIITRKEPENFQLQTQSLSCPNCNEGHGVGFCNECVPHVLGAPNHFSAETNRKFTIVRYSLYAVIFYFAFFTIGYDLFLWDQFPNFDTYTDFVVNIVIAMTLFTIYGGLIYLMTMMMMMIFVNPIENELEAVDTQNYGKYENYYFGKLNQSGKLAYLKQYNHEMLDWGWYDLSKSLKDVTYSVVAGLISCLFSVILPILLADLFWFGGKIGEFLSSEVIGAITYLISPIILVIIVTLAEMKYNEHCAERLYRRVSHKFVSEFVDDLIQNTSQEQTQ